VPIITVHRHVERIVPRLPEDPREPSMTTVAPVPTRLASCGGECGAALHREHHDRLLTVDTDPDVLLGLMELAVTWHELDYSAEPVVGPRQWLTFADRHQWMFPDRAAWAFALAVDIVGRRVVGAPPSELDRRVVLDLVRG
jgi:hypothetical protein